MRRYTAVLSNKARKHLDKLHDNIAEPILDAIASLEENPRPMGHIKLKGRARISNKGGELSYHL